MVALLQSQRPLKARDRSRNFLYQAGTPAAQARCLRSWTPFIDTAFYISAFRISDFMVLDDHIPFFDKTIRKIVTSTDLLFIVSIGRARADDSGLVTNLLETRSRKELPTVLDDVRENRWEGIYEEICYVSE